MPTPPNPVPRTPASSATPDLPGVEAVVLAGGLSSRMGRDKSRLRLGGRSLLDLSGDAARALGIPVRTVRRDAVPRCGPLGGVCTAMLRPRAEILIFLSCDMPRVSPRLLRRLLSRLTVRRLAAFVDEDGRIGFPFALRRSARDVVERLRLQGSVSLRNLADALHAARVPVPIRWRAELANLNTPEALLAVRTSRTGSPSQVPAVGPAISPSRTRPPRGHSTDRGQNDGHPTAP